MNKVVSKESSCHNRDKTIILPGTPLYEDMKDIIARETQEKLKLYTHEEVFGKESDGRTTDQD